MADEATADALGLLASNLEHQGCPLQAINCLQARISLKLLPDQEARARISLGRLLLMHTMNHKDAKQQLMKAVRNWGNLSQQQVMPF